MWMVNNKLEHAGSLHTILHMLYLHQLVPLSEDLFGYIPGISTTTIQPRNSPGADHRVRSKKQQTSADMLIYRLSERKLSAL